MAKQVTFGVSVKGGPSTKCSWNAPENANDPRWAEVVSNPSEDIHELALQNLIIKIQGGARKALQAGGPDGAQKYVASYKYGARVGGFRPAPRVSADAAKELRFTKAQIEALRAAGVEVEAAA